MSKVNRLVKITHNKGNPVRFFDKPSRNDLCPCQSGLKFKNCHIGNWQEFVKEQIEKRKNKK